MAFFNDVYDLTELIQKNRHLPEVEPMIQAAGTDITHWFDSKTKEPRKMIDHSGKAVYYCPNGPFLNLDTSEDITAIPWWKNQDYMVGKLTKKSQMIRIINTLSDTEDKLEVPQEETIWEILDRYEEVNSHARSYTWKRKGKILNMDASLKDNGIIDQSEEYVDFEVPEELQYVPAIHIHFNDDLTSK